MCISKRESKRELDFLEYKIVYVIGQNEQNRSPLNNRLLWSFIATRNAWRSICSS